MECSPRDCPPRSSQQWTVPIYTGQASGSIERGPRIATFAAREPNAGVEAVGAAAIVPMLGLAENLLARLWVRCIRQGMTKSANVATFRVFNLWRTA
ncbi:hypothetical protein GCM10025779_05810 [Arthrobacter cryoconiti]